MLERNIQKWTLPFQFMSPQQFPPTITHIDSGKIVNSGKKQLTELHQWATNLESFQVGHRNCFETLTQL